MPSSMKYELRWHASDFFFHFLFFSLAFVASHSEVCCETGYWWFPRATAFKCAVFPRLSASRPCKFFRAAAIPLVEAGGSFKVQLGKWHGCINSFSSSDFPITFLLDLFACLCPPVTPCLTRKRCVFYHAHADVVHVICIARRSVYTPLVHTAALSADWYFFMNMLPWVELVYEQQVYSMNFTVELQLL